MGVTCNKDKIIDQEKFNAVGFDDWSVGDLGERTSVGQGGQWLVAGG